MQSISENGSRHTDLHCAFRLHGSALDVSSQTPPAPSEDLLFSPPAHRPANAAAGSHASSSDSGMSDERNADSVLFKLDTLKDAQAEQAATQGASRQMARLAAAAPASGGSGLIDIKELAGLAADGTAPQGSSDSGVGDAAESGSAASASSSASTRWRVHRNRRGFPAGDLPS